MGGVYIPKIREAKVKQNGTRVLVLIDGKLVLDLPWEAALDLSKGIRIQAKRAEELAKAPQIIQDQAVIQRAGFPVGLTNNPDIQKEALKVAQHDRKLRKFMPGGIKSQGAVGTPTLIKRPPPNKGGNNAKL